MIYKFKGLSNNTTNSIKSFVLIKGMTIMVYQVYSFSIYIAIPGLDRPLQVDFNSDEEMQTAYEEINLYLSYDKETNPEKFV